ncbi:V-type ATP synthase subunit I [Peptoniphilus sp.]|uniref:V-type ATP synthase subunit I n=1 Tax=Peptoniphilus sp. TaxID=1971214 RepID=UPI003D8D1D33
MGRLKDMDSIILDILNMGVMEFISSDVTVKNNEFVFSLDNEENVERNLELNYIAPFKEDEEHFEEVKKAEEIMKFFGIKKVDDKYFKNINLDEDIDSFYDNFKTKIKEYEEMKKKVKLIETLKDNYKLFKNVDIDLRDISNLKYFTARFGFLDKDARYRLKKNYGNILALIYHTGTVDDRELYLAIYPKEVEKDIDRVLRSLNFNEIDILGRDVMGTAEDMFTNLKEEEDSLRRRIWEYDQYKENIMNSRYDDLNQTLAHMLAFEKIEKAKKYMLRSKNYFYASGWVAESNYKELENKLSKYEKIDIYASDADLDKRKTPTKLKNSNFFKPFELLINMYGTPNYDEFDPTIIFGISYMILFGSMFGDLGQGAIFAIAGIILSKKKNKDFGGLLLRMGVSSMFFGLMYGSVFGSENLIPAIWFRPFDSINKTLVIAIFFGVVLSAISYGVGIYNNIKNKEYDEAFFGKEGFLGVLIFIAMINIGVNIMGGSAPISTNVGIIILVVALLLMLFKRPILQTFFKKEFDQKAGDYYIESSFGLLEALLSTMSGIISFIRVGAFAINHVGLFLAFKTLGQMIGSTGGNIAVLIIGNIVIIGLEGLIVFIQSLRLEYYEMFSKFYSGDGKLFEADSIY